MFAIGKKHKLLALGAVTGLVVAACSGAGSSSTAQPSPAPSLPAATATPTPVPMPTTAPAATTHQTRAPRETPPTAGPTPTPTREQLGIVTFSTFEWPRTDFSKRSVDYDEILQAQVRDGIPAIDAPIFESGEAASMWLDGRSPVLVVELNAEAKGYPIGMLMFHEIVNDVIGGVPVAVTYCPLCNTALAFERVIDGQPVEFGVSGMLRNSDLIMYDRLTDSWWQQITGEAIVGDLTGTQLKPVAANIISFADFRGAFPQGQVLSRESGPFGFYRDAYGQNPYVGYDSEDNQPFLFRGLRDSRLPTMERLVALTANGVPKAYPFDDLRAERVINDEVGGEPVVIFWKPGTASALGGAVIDRSRDIGATAVFDPRVDGRLLTFEAKDDEAFLDKETGTIWNLLGKAIEGPLLGNSLVPLIHANHFWFAWAAFYPDTLIYGR